MPAQAVRSKFEQIHEDLSRNVTHNYQRNELLTAIDLVFHSVLRFKFRGQSIQKGWVECAIVGDTGQAKSTTIQAILEHYRLGEFCDGAATSFAGLVGGVNSLGRRNTITWGRIPLNDGRLVAVDELKSMPVEQMGLFSSIRSSGIAQITKILTERTLARTRLIWASNPRSGRHLNSYNYGVQAVTELFGKIEDARRLDFALTVAMGEVPDDLPVKGPVLYPPGNHKYTSEACNALVRWAWTRKEHEIHFTPEAEEALVEHATAMCAKYSEGIPLVHYCEQIKKLARLSVAAACRVFSTDDGERVLVKPEHAQFVFDFLNYCYDKPSMAYDAWSIAAKKAESEVVAQTHVASEYERMSRGTALTNFLMGMTIVRRYQLQDSLGWGNDRTQEFISWGIKNGLLRPAMNGYAKTPAMTNYLRLLAAGSTPDGKAEEPRPEYQDDGGMF